MTDPRFRQMTDFLRGLGTDEIGHTGSKGFLAHLVSVYRDLQRWGGDQDLCRAGLFHSVYGTEKFRQFCLPLDRREEIRDLIGERAEWLAFLNCFMERTSWDSIFIDGGAEREVRNRETGDTHVHFHPVFHVYRVEQRHPNVIRVRHAVGVPAAGKITQ